MFGYRVPPANAAMLVSGGKSRSGEAPYRIVLGHGTFVVPGFRKVSFLSFRMYEAQVTEDCVTAQGITAKVTAVVAFKVGQDPESIVNAAQRFLDDQNQMVTLTGQIFAGHLRSIVGSMTVEQLITERQKLALEVLDASKGEMARLGLVVDSFQISSFNDGNAGYIQAMSAKATAAVQRDAQIAQADAKQASAEKEQESERAQAQYAADTAKAKASYDADRATAEAEAQQRTVGAQQKSLAVQAAAQAETNAAKARAEQAGPLAAAQAAQEVTDQQTALAQRQAELRQQQLVSEIVRPAEAAAEATRITAEAEATRIKTIATATDSSNRVMLDQKLVEMLPEMVAAASAGLQGANLTVFNGSDGVGEIVTQLVGQGMSILDTLRGNLGRNDKPEAREIEGGTKPTPGR